MAKHLPKHPFAGASPDVECRQRFYGGLVCWERKDAPVHDLTLGSPGLAGSAGRVIEAYRSGNFLAQAIAELEVALNSRHRQQSASQQRRKAKTHPAGMEDD